MVMPGNLTPIADFERALEVDSTPGMRPVRERGYLTGYAGRRTRRSEDILRDKAIPNLDSESSKVIIYALDILPKKTYMSMNEEVTERGRNCQDSLHIWGMETTGTKSGSQTLQNENEKMSLLSNELTQQRVRSDASYTHRCLGIFVKVDELVTLIICFSVEEALLPRVDEASGRQFHLEAAVASRNGDTLETLHFFIKPSLPSERVTAVSAANLDNERRQVARRGLTSVAGNYMNICSIKDDTRATAADGFAKTTREGGVCGGWKGGRRTWNWSIRLVAFLRSSAHPLVEFGVWIGVDEVNRKGNAIESDCLEFLDARRFVEDETIDSDGIK